MSLVSKPSIHSPSDKPVKSPCISICVLGDGDICTGCFRSGDEIRDWGTYSNEQRLAVLALGRERERKVNPFL